jgi:hypothetical protein
LFDSSSSTKKLKRKKKKEKRKKEKTLDILFRSPKNLKNCEKKKNLVLDEHTPFYLPITLSLIISVAFVAVPQTPETVPFVFSEIFSAVSVTFWVILVT